jgi:hypothetical protein
LATVPDAGLHPGTFPAYLAYRSIFFPHESASRGAYLSFLSQSAFFFREALRSRKRNQVIQKSPKTAYRGCKPAPARIGIFPQAAQPSHVGQHGTLDELSVKKPMQEATAGAAIPFSPRGDPCIIVKSISAMQPLRRPTTRDCAARSGERARKTIN